VNKYLWRLFSLKKAYLPRIADKLLKNALESAGAVLIEGLKWCGKTRTAEEMAASVIYMQDPDQSESYILAADTKPSLLLQGSTPRLLDEWQTAPVLWDAVRFAVDQRGDNGQFILTGSAVPVDNAVKHSGTGRISRILMRPMSLFESGESGGGVSLRSLFDGIRTIGGFSTISIEKMAFCLARGGWPASAGREDNAILRRVYDYVDAVINNDISRVDDVEKNPARVLALMRSLARNTSTMAAITTIRDDIAADEKSLTEKSVSSYMNALRRLFVIEDLPAWRPALRSKTAIRTSPKRHFVDPSIAAAVLRAAPDALLKDFKTFGLLFESLCVRDLRIYAQILDGEVFHYYDKSGLEADAVICLKDGRWAAVEIKMGVKEIEKAAKNLLALKDRINTDKMHEPSFLLVVTAGEPAYRRDDGVFVAPIGCLRE
jgi:uncharacterized protein